ncbi:tripartite tricarboxylate transporter substrate binding protein [Marinobacterium sedimentorum]|uniref:tripartite tricarboxylate transporter substrate binding protein n=1 Tax=Marinobacterium sedimentorum TaxID=2927804 RepID=UPI0020C66FD0|nr:tripartite tricarboxylate transporter substrate binding protein [Marinobacterium sedimentorum]MCP8689496.1 tripartite tricarboxylate transporter substrate binding protein [Marinobacterium sedimentorum]
MTNNKIVKAVSTSMFMLALGAGAAQAGYPEKPIQLIVPWSAGGGTDAVARQMAAGLEQELGQPVNVVNRTGGGGIVGHTVMTMARPDGYTLGLATAEIGTFRHIGSASISYEDLTPIALINFDSASINVNADSKWKTLDQAMSDIKAHSGEYTMSGTTAGSAYHLAFAGFLSSEGIDPNSVRLVPSEGAAPAMQELAAGGVDIVYNSLPESESMVKAGHVRSLGVFAEQRLDAFPNVPATIEVTGNKWAAGTWRGLAGPKGLPDEVVQKVSQAAKRVWESNEFQSFMASRGFGTQWKGPSDFGAFMAESDANNGVIIEKLGLAQ